MTPLFADVLILKFILRVFCEKRGLDLQLYLFELFFVLFMIKVKEDNAIVRDGLAIVTFFVESAVLLAA